MKKIRIDDITFHDRLQQAKIWDDDCDCYGIEIDNKLHLYYREDSDKYYLYIFDNSYKQIISDDNFMSKLLKNRLDNGEYYGICDLCCYISDVMNDNKIDNNDIKIELKEIIKCMK